MERLGFYVCVADLEDELIRALVSPPLKRSSRRRETSALPHTAEATSVEGRPLEEQLPRYMGSGGRRKIRYARLLVEALDPPVCLDPSTVLAHV